LGIHAPIENEVFCELRVSCWAPVFVLRTWSMPSARGSVDCADCAISITEPRAEGIDHVRRTKTGAQQETRSSQKTSFSIGAWIPKSLNFFKGSAEAGTSATATTEGREETAAETDRSVYFFRPDGLGDWVATGVKSERGLLEGEVWAGRLCVIEGETDAAKVLCRVEASLSSLWVDINRDAAMPAGAPDETGDNRRAVAHAIVSRALRRSADVDEARLVGKVRIAQATLTRDDKNGRESDA
ncbi:MAG: hypothetical protein AAFY97_03730, partial [Pseudomonadota bacterium]